MGGGLLESCFALINLYKLGSLAIMHGNCLIGGLRAKSFTPLSLFDDKECKQYTQTCENTLFCFVYSLL